MKLLTFCCMTALLLDVHAAPVIGISDGDTLKVLENGEPVTIRLSDIDAPEKSQAFGERSKQSLSEMCFKKDANFVTRSKDRYGRSIARVYCSGIDVNRAQIERGMAWHYVRYSSDTELSKVQEHAKASKRGLWADTSPIPPWEFRRSK